MYVYMTGECPMPYIPGNIKKNGLSTLVKLFFSLLNMFEYHGLFIPSQETQFLIYKISLFCGMTVIWQQYYIQMLPKPIMKITLKNGKDWIIKTMYQNQFTMIKQ